MSDRYAQLVNSRIGGFIAGNVGLPKPVELERYEPDQPLIRGEVLLGAAPGGRLLDTVTQVLDDADVAIRTVRENEEPVKALVFDATGITDSTQLRELWEFFHPKIRGVESSGRVIVLGTPPEACGSPREATAQRALEGFSRSVGKEVRKGATSQLVYIAPGA